MAELGALGLGTAIAAGAVSFLSPCVLPLVPGYLSYVAGQPVGGPRRPHATERLAALGLSALFVLGFSTVFILFGASASALGQLLVRYRYELNLAGGAIVTVFGLLMLGLFSRAMWLQREYRFHPHLLGGRPVGAYVLGLAFAFGWTPCIGPVLGAILTLSASASSLDAGVALLAAYSAGLGLPFLAVALFTRELAGRLGRLRRAGYILQLVAGLALVAMGIAMMTGQLTAFAYWLLRTFPVLGRIG
ncbi:MAG: cytochrome c biogenesis CcdA family protein [Burkholderiales bacterium]